MSRLPNPAWVDKALTASWATLTARALPLPVVQQRTYRRPALEGRPTVTRQTAQELGCGHYGCVLATADPAVVLKLTTDPSEAAFVTLMLQRGLREPGLVQYYEILPLAADYRGQRIYAIWREAADDVGKVLEVRYEMRVHGDVRRTVIHPLDTFGSHLARFKAAAHDVRRLLSPSDLGSHSLSISPAGWALLEDAYAIDEGEAEQHVYINEDTGMLAWMLSPWAGQAHSRATSIAVALLACRMTARMVAGTPDGQLVGQALGNLLEQRILLTDVHPGNIGRATHRSGADRGKVVITDPGHMLPLSPDVAGVRWRRLPNPTVRLYHGSPFSGLRDFRDFRSPAPLVFFTPSRRVAEEYARMNPQYSGTTRAAFDPGGAARSPTVYEVAVDISPEETFDTRHPKHEDRYRQYRRAMRDEDPDDPAGALMSTVTEDGGRALLPPFPETRRLFRYLGPSFKAIWVSEGSQGPSLAVRKEDLGLVRIVHGERQANPRRRAELDVAISAHQEGDLERRHYTFKKRHADGNADVLVGTPDALARHVRQREYFEEENAELLVSSAKGATIGAYIEWLRVSPEGRGYGGKLFEFVLSDLARLGIDHIVLHPVAMEPDAELYQRLVDFYESHGFEVIFEEGDADDPFVLMKAR